MGELCFERRVLIGGTARTAPGAPALKTPSPRAGLWVCVLVGDMLRPASFKKSGNNKK